MSLYENPYAGHDRLSSRPQAGSGSFQVSYMDPL